MLKHLLIIVSCAITPMFVAAEAPSEFVEHITALSDGIAGPPVRLEKGAAATTEVSFKPAVEILIEAKTDSTNLRLTYAADQVIFNWESGRGQLRVDGGPANGQHRTGAGLIPTNKFVTIRWVVTQKKQSIYVDGKLRFEHSGDYSHLDSPVSVYGAHGSTVTVKSIKVKQLANE